MKKHLTLLYLLAFVPFAMAQTAELPTDSVVADSVVVLPVDTIAPVRDSVAHVAAVAPQPSFRFEVRNDTLYIIAEGDTHLPHHAVLQPKYEPDMYCRLYTDKKVVAKGAHPADELYKKWPRSRVNPYGCELGSFRDSARVDLTGFTAPVPGRVSSVFGSRTTRMHYGVDLGLKLGDAVKAAWEGQIRVVDFEPNGYGNYVVIRHANGLETVYGHMDRVLVEPDQFVKTGEVIGLGGTTGRSSGPHLHFETRYLGNPFDPSLIIDFQEHATVGDVYFITRKGTFYHETEALRMANMSAEEKAAALKNSKNPYKSTSLKDVDQTAAASTSAKSPSATKTTDTAKQSADTKKQAADTKKTGGKSSPQYYTVVKGDTLSGIASRNGTTVKALCELNGITSKTPIKIGQKLRIK